MPVASRKCAAKAQTTPPVVVAVMPVWSVSLKNPPERQPSPAKLVWSKSLLLHLPTLIPPPPRRIRSLEAHVADIRVTQAAIQSTLLEIVAHLRGTAPLTHRSPSTFSQGQYTHSPTVPSIGSPPLSAPPNGAHIADPNLHRGPSTPTAYHPSIPPILTAPSRDARPSVAPHAQPNVSDFHSPSYPNPAGGQPFSFTPSSGAVLPPFSSISAIGVGPVQGPSALPYLDSSQRSHRNYHVSAPPGSKRTLPPSSDVTSADSSEIDDDDSGELPASGLVAPWEVLRGLADVAIERAAKVSADIPLNLSLEQPDDVSLRRVAKPAANPRAEPERLPLSDRVDLPKGGRFVTKFRVA